MPHDAKSRPLAPGDRVLIPAIITELSISENYCNVTIETVHGRKPDGQKERISAINAATLVRDNPGDQADKEPL